MKSWITTVLAVGVWLWFLISPNPWRAVEVPEKPIKSYEELKEEMRILRKDLEWLKELQRQYNKGTLKSA